jgi:hypothetical protein
MDFAYSLSSSRSFSFKFPDFTKEVLIQPILFAEREEDSPYKFRSCIILKAENRQNAKGMNNSKILPPTTIP